MHPLHRAKAFFDCINFITGLIIRQLLYYKKIPCIFIDFIYIIT